MSNRRTRLIRALTPQQFMELAYAPTRSRWRRTLDLVKGAVITTILVPLLWIVSKCTGSERLLLVEELAWDALLTRLDEVESIGNSTKVSGENADTSNEVGIEFEADFDLGPEDPPDGEQIH